MNSHCQECQQVEKEALMEIKQCNGHQFISEPQKHLVSNEYEKFQAQEERIAEHSRKLAMTNSGCCSKHFRCIDNHKSPQKAQNFLHQIPANLFENEQPIKIDVHPQKPIYTVHCVDDLVRNKLIEHKRQRVSKKKEKEQEKNERSKRLKELAQSTKNALKKSKKKEFKDTGNWGHSIFTVNQEKPQSQPVQVKKQREKPDIQLKPIEQRIRSYKQTEKQLKKQQQQEEKCKHHYKSKTKINIEENAEKIMEEMKREKQRQAEHKKAIEGKIKAIQMESMKNVKKSKKVPVNSEIEFIVDIPKKQSKKKKKKTEPKQQTKSTKTDRRTFLKMKKKAKSIETKKTQKTQEKPQQVEENQEKQYEKFYVWNVPIQEQDFLNVVQNKDPNFRSKKKGKTFREEVDEYLQQKFHKGMKKQTQEMKEKQFNEMVEAKKKQYLQNFMEERGGGMEEVFWNEDEVFRAEKYKNFAYG